MKPASIFVYALSLLLFFLSAGISAEPIHSKKTVTIGVLFDGDHSAEEPGIKVLRSELKALLGSKYTIQIPDNKVYRSDWSLETIEKNYNLMIADKKIDIILGIGALTSSVIAGKKPYPKPIIALGIFDPVLQGLSPVKNNSSGIPNLTYILGNKSVRRDLETFHKVYPYKNAGFVYHSELGKIVPTRAGKLDSLMAKLKTKFTLIPIANGIEDVLDALTGIDAIYIVYLGKFQGEEKNKLINALNLKKIPTFSSNISNVKSGMLASIAPEEPLIKILRRVSLNIEAILEGTNASELNVFTHFNESLTINMATAKKIGYYPKFTILSEAELINDDIEEGIDTLNLIEVMNESLKTNLDLKISESTLQMAERDVSKARSDYFPTVSLQADATIIDKDSARYSGGAQAERTTNGDVNVSQLLYSDQIIGNITSQKHLYKASEFDHQGTRLDVALDAATAYFDILRAKTNRKILKDNVELIKRNLEISKQREVVGYSGRSDVFRWKSQLATASTDHLAAKEEVKLSKINLNRLLNRKQSQPIAVEDASLRDDLFNVYTGDDISKYIDNRISLEIFTDFFIQEALTSAPELEELKENKAALERTLSTYKRKRFVPSAMLSGNAGRNFSREGEGSDVTGVDPVDDPWSVALTFSLPLYEGGATGVDIQKTRIEITRLKRQKALLMQSIEQQARSAISAVTVKMVTLASSKKAAGYARQSLELVQDSYAKGTVSVVELADAQNNALTSDLAAINSIYEFLISILNLERVGGEFRLLLPDDQKDVFAEKFSIFYKSKTGKKPVSTDS